ncbi:hypothetical protein ACFQL4_04215 [Halosimplex aquaticum]
MGTGALRGDDVLGIEADGQVLVRLDGESVEGGGVAAPCPPSSNANSVISPTTIRSSWPSTSARTSASRSTVYSSRR